MADFEPSQGLVPSSGARASTPARNVGNNVYQTGFDDETVKKYDFDNYKGRLNETDRIFLVRPKALIKARTHFHEAKLKSVRCNSKYEQTDKQELLIEEAGCCKMLGKSSLRFAALILRYVTDRQGNLIRPFQPPELRLWLFSTDKYFTLKGINGDFPLDTVDLSVTCTEAQYQKMTILAKPPDQCIYRMPNFPQDLRKQIETWADASLPKIPGELGKQMTDADIAKELGQAGAAPARMTSADAPISGDVFNDLVGAAKPSAS